MIKAYQHSPNTGSRRRAVAIVLAAAFLVLAVAVFLRRSASVAERDVGQVPLNGSPVQQANSQVRHEDEEAEDLGRRSEGQSLHVLDDEGNALTCQLRLTTVGLTSGNIRKWVANGDEPLTLLAASEADLALVVEADGFVRRWIARVSQAGPSVRLERAGSVRASVVVAPGRSAPQQVPVDVSSVSLIPAERVSTGEDGDWRRDRILTADLVSDLSKAIDGRGGSGFQIEKFIDGYCRSLAIDRVWVPYIDGKYFSRSLPATSSLDWPDVPSRELCWGLGQPIGDVAIEPEIDRDQYLIQNRMWPLATSGSFVVEAGSHLSVKAVVGGSNLIRILGVPQLSDGREYAYEPMLHYRVQANAKAVTRWVAMPHEVEARDGVLRFRGCMPGRYKFIAVVAEPEVKYIPFVCDFDYAGGSVDVRAEGTVTGDESVLSIADVPGWTGGSLPVRVMTFVEPIYIFTARIVPGRECAITGILGKHAGVAAVASEWQRRGLRTSKSYYGFREMPRLFVIPLEPPEEPASPALAVRVRSVGVEALNGVSFMTFGAPRYCKDTYVACLRGIAELPVENARRYDALIVQGNAGGVSYAGYMSPLRTGDVLLRPTGRLVVDVGGSDGELYGLFPSVLDKYAPEPLPMSPWFAEAKGGYVEFTNVLCDTQLSVWHGGNIVGSVVARGSLTRAALK